MRKVALDTKIDDVKPSSILLAACQMCLGSSKILDT